MNGGRKEKRSLKKLAVQLSNETVVAEYASTENVSAKGARIRTVRPWRLDTRVLVKSTWYELRAQARVVYCQTLPDTTFAVGLELLNPPDAWLKQ
jgi:PilZ domain